VLTGHTPGPSTRPNPTLGQQIASHLPLNARQRRPGEPGHRPRAGALPPPPAIEIPRVPYDVLPEIASRLDRPTWKAFRQVSKAANAAAGVRALRVRTRDELYSALGRFEASGFTKLAAKNCDLGIKEARQLAAITSITSLDLTDNFIGDAGAQALAANTSITSLNLLGNSIGSAGAQALAANTKITSLNLGLL
jgi:Leucine Rich repeat